MEKMNENYKRMSHEQFLQCIDKICNDLSIYIKDYNIKIDYICPILRSGAVPAVYISNKLNIVKFAPIQIKHVAYNNGENKIELLFNPFDSIKLHKKDPVFLVVEALQSTGKSVELCINEIRNKYENAKILYVCISKEYGSRNFSDITTYENFVYYYKGDNDFSEEECKKLDIQYTHPLFPWENLEMELEHPDDLEDNIFF